MTKDGEVLGEMNGGTVFGELAILYNCKRTASVKGTFKSDNCCGTLLWVIDVLIVFSFLFLSQL